SRCRASPTSATTGFMSGSPSSTRTRCASLSRRPGPLLCPSAWPRNTLHRGVPTLDDGLTLGYGVRRWLDCLLGRSSTDLRHWFNLDCYRPNKRVGLVLDLGKGLVPVITPDDSER